MTFIPREPSATPEAVTDIADDFRSLFGRITGNSGDLYSGYNTTSMTFSDVLASDISSAGAVNRDHWGEASLACTVAAEIMDMWSEDLEWYKTKIESYRSQLETTAPYIDSSDDANGEGDSSRAIFVSGLQEMADQDWATLEEKASERSGEISGGTDPSNVAKLIESGRLGWLPYNLLGNRMPMPVNAELGTSDGKALEDLLESGEINNSSYNAIMRNIELLNERAESALRRGEELSEHEIAYLESLYEALEGLEAPSDSGGSSGAIALPEVIEEQVEDEKSAEALLAALGTAAVVLSNEKLGGGYPQLPESIKDASAGPTLGDDSYHNSGDGDTRYGADLANLSILLGNAPDDMEAGQQLSTNISLSVGTLFNEANADTDSMIGETTYDVIIETAGEDALGDLIEVSTRNADSNHTILTQDVPEGLHFDSDRATELMNDALLGLLTYQWEEGGEHANGSAVTGLFDWIPGDSINGDYEEQEHAAEAMLGFFDFISIEENHDALMRTGNEVVIEGRGDEEESKYDDVGFGQYNGEITNSLTEMYEAYIYSFAGQAGYDNNGIPNLDYERPLDAWDPDNNMLTLSPTERLLFLELIMTNDDSAARAHVSTEVFNTAMQIEALESGDDTDLMRKSGTLSSLFDGALQNEFNARELGAKEQEAREEKIANTAKDFGKELIGDIPVVGKAISMIDDYYSDEITEMVISQLNPEEHGLDADTEESVKNRMKGAVLDMALDEYNNGNGDNPLDLVGDSRREQDDNDSTVTKILEKNGILSYDDDGNPTSNKDDAFKKISELSGDSLAELNWAFSEIANATNTTWHSGIPNLASNFIDNAAGNFDGRSTGEDNPYLDKNSGSRSSN